MNRAYALSWFFRVGPSFYSVAGARLFFDRVQRRIFSLGVVPRTHTLSERSGLESLEGILYGRANGTRGSREELLWYCEARVSLQGASRHGESSVGL